MSEAKDMIEFIEALNAQIYGEHVTLEEMRQTVNEITGISDLMRGEVERLRAEDIREKVRLALREAKRAPPVTD